MQRLYYSQPYIKTFESRVISCEKGKKEWYEIILEQTVFFPEGGGQPWDTGTLNGILVAEVHEKDGQVIHYTQSPLETGSSVTGILDWDRRYDNMQQHSGEHILTGLIHKQYGFDNVGFHMGREEVTIDFNGVITTEDLERLELEANQVIYQNLRLQVSCPTEEELDSLEYRSKKELSGEVRIITIPGVDVCACCGTHVERTGEVGMIKVLGSIRYKGGVRISILCGRPALMHYSKRQKQTTALSVLLSVKPDAVAEAVEKLKQDISEREFILTSLYKELIMEKTKQYPKKDKPLILFEKQMTPVQLRQYCTLLYEQEKGSVVLICSGENSSYQYALGSAKRDMKALSRSLNGCLNGRGGGSAFMAQGTFTAAREDILAVMSKIDGEE